MGNLNYTFIARKQNYNVERQLEVMLRAVGMFGIDAERTGRNDIAVKGRKFSGNAFYHSGDCRCHHGTLLINEDREHMSRYLNVSQEKLKSKSVDSVNARVTNLSELCPEITVKGMKKRMVQAYSECYKLPVRPLPASRIDESAVDENERFFSSSAWIYGRRVKSNCRITRRFEWGDVSVELLVNGGRIKSANVFSDAMEQDFISRLPGAIEGCVYEAEAVKNIIEKIVKATSETGAASRIGADIISLISDAI